MKVIGKKAEKDLYPGVRSLFGLCFLLLVGVGGLFFMLFISLSSPVFSGKPSPRVGVRIVLHLAV